MTKILFESFDAVSTKEWKQKIQFDLKGVDYNEALIYKSFEGIDIKPFYNQEDLSETKNQITHPSSWKNAQKIEVNEAAVIANKKALKAIKEGAESIYFVILNENCIPEELLKDISEEITIYIETLFLSSKFARELDKIAATFTGDIFLLVDSIGNLSRTGNWFDTLADDHRNLISILKETQNLKSIISVDISLLQNAGATMIQQLAYGLAHANEYLNILNTNKMDSFSEAFIVFKVAIGSNYFFEIAKLRALRMLWTSLSSEFDLLKKCHILAHPSHRNKTILDYNVNMLRTTTECMSAILGGADTIYNLRYDVIYNLENDFGNRIALNQLLILKNESYFDIVTNPASGSYYIESLTRQLSEKALELFKNIEQGGGYLTQLKEGTIQRKIKDSAKKEQDLFDNEHIILTGANKFKNPSEDIPNLEKIPFSKKNVIKTLLNPIVQRRLCEKIDKKTAANANN